MSSKTEAGQGIQLDFVVRGSKLIPRKAAEILRTPVIVDSIRMIQISTAGQVTTEVLVIKGYPYPPRRKKPLVPFLYRGTVPEEIVNLPWDLRAMWFFSHLEDPTAYKLGPVIDLETSFPELNRHNERIGGYDSTWRSCI